ncbi:hypothetical protein M8494_33140 (plasmid) [Serratia ureilytica]
MLEDKIGAHEAVPEERKSGKCRLLILVSMKKASPASHVHVIPVSMVGGSDTQA